MERSKLQVIHNDLTYLGNRVTMPLEPDATLIGWLGQLAPKFRENLELRDLFAAFAADRLTLPKHWCHKIASLDHNDMAFTLSRMEMLEENRKNNKKLFGVLWALRGNEEKPT